MVKTIGAPGALLILLHRSATSTHVLIGPEERRSGPFAWAAARKGIDQWALAEELCVAHWANEVSRLYASALSTTIDDHRVGLFVGFLDGDSTDAPLPALHEWRDLREAAASIPEPWGALLATVRSRFIAQSPDEALRVR